MANRQKFFPERLLRQGEESLGIKPGQPLEGDLEHAGAFYDETLEANGSRGTERDRVGWLRETTDAARDEGGSDRRAGVGTLRTGERRISVGAGKGAAMERGGRKEE